MSTLYELQQKWFNLQDALLSCTDDEESQAAVQAALEMIGGSVEEKAEGYAKIIRNMDSDIAGLKAEEERIYNRRKSIENNKHRLKSDLQASMMAMGKDKIKTPLFTVSIKASAPAVVVDDEFIQWATANAACYLRYRQPEVDKKALADVLKAGAEIPHVKFAEPTKSLTIR